MTENLIIFIICSTEMATMVTYKRTPCSFTTKYKDNALALMQKYVLTIIETDKKETVAFYINLKVCFLQVKMTRITWQSMGVSMFSEFLKQLN